ncbi:MAG: ribosome silencing factor, partial [Pseudomonas sp.]|nr:ribosome silencing factor [Pseudomonas sp.]
MSKQKNQLSSDEVVKLAVAALEDLKAQDILSINVR